MYQQQGSETRGENSPPRVRFPSAGDSESVLPSTPKETVQNSQEDEDVELRRATNLAMAIQNNPNMSLEEIQHLQQSKHQQELLESNSELNANNKKVRSFRFDGSRLTAIRAAVTGNPSLRENSSHGEQLEDSVDYMNREKSRRLLDGHRIKAAFHRDPTKDTRPTLGGPVNLEVDNSLSTAGIGRLMCSKGRTPPPSPIKGGMDASGRALVHLSSVGAESTGNPNPTPRSASSSLLQNLQSVMSHGRQVPMSKVPIRLTGIAWKRRGGMGKYATTGGWERRRIELQGTRILYYAKDETEDSPDDDEEAEIGPSASPSLIASDELLGGKSTKRDNSSGEDVGEGVVVAKQSTWFENAFSQNQEDPNTPRGFLDLAKEKASVHAALGHGGAPTPFVISIKVRGETKWKFCFDHHRTQMEWLAALTDVVVQNSVDVYNAHLLEGADPTHNDGLSMLTSSMSPPVKSPAPPENGGGGTRLWQTQSYNISSQATRDEEDDDENDDASELDDNDVDIMAILPTEEEHKKAQVLAVEESPRKWVVPDKNLQYLAFAFNAVVIIARVSSLSVERYWFLVVFANAFLYCLLAQEPDWHSVLSYVRASPDENKKGVVGTKTKEKVSISKSDASSPSKAKSNLDFKPVAGTTTVKLKNPTDLPVNSKNEVFAGWRCPPGDILLVRSHGYLTTKKKVPSPGELYELVQCDIFEAPTRYPDMAARVKLPEVSFANDESKDLKTWRAPDIFVVTIALPTDPPKLTRTSGDGGGYTITMYFAMKQETRDILRRVTAEGYDSSKEDYGDDMQQTKVNAVRLLEEWVRRAPTDQQWFSRFKCVPNAHNLREIGMPSWISKYNGKPFLIKRPGVTGFIYEHPELSLFEFDISLHPFPYLARQGICFLKESFFKKVLVSFGFVIEGRAEDELPECVIGCLQLCYPDPAHAIQAKDFFSGTSARSF
ncbi:hypothetical protein ACA910_003920 [Epithemia clementina (nom. ined.)]